MTLQSPTVSANPESASILKTIQSLGVFKSFLDELQSVREAPGLGLIRAGRTPWIAAIARSLNRPLLVLTDKPSTAAVVYDELQFWLGGRPVEILSAPDPLFYEPGAWDPVIRGERICALTALIKYQLPGRVFPDPEASPATRSLPRTGFQNGRIKK